MEDLKSINGQLKKEIKKLQYAAKINENTIKNLKLSPLTKSVSITDEEILGKEITMDKIEVTGCIGCPMLKWDESIIGYWCGAVKGESIDDQIEQGESPTWCPLKKSSITITLITEKCSSDIR